MSRVQIIGFWSLVHAVIISSDPEAPLSEPEEQRLHVSTPGASKPTHPKTVKRGAPPTPERLDNSQIGG